MPPVDQTTLKVEIIKQHPGAQTAARRVKANIPGKFFPQLQPAEQKALYDGEAVEFRERYSFSKHAKGRGAAHHGPGVRVVCMSDAIDDPDNNGFWTTLALFNRWRHTTRIRTTGRLSYSTSTSFPQAPNWQMLLLGSLRLAILVCAVSVRFMYDDQ